MHSRRAFVATSALALAAAPAAARAKAILTRIDGGLSPYFPTQDAEEVRSIVGASHTDIDAVREFVTRRPDLSKAAWDWGFGDWESALGAASHMGRPDIAELLIASGARPDIFTFAMLNQVDALRAICQANPGIQRLLGPHGTFTLMRHAKMRNGDAADVEAYLAELGDADVPQPDLGLPEPDSRPFLGEYTPEGAPGVVFKIAYRDRQRVLSLQRDDQAVRNLFNQGGGVFCPAGAPAVRIRFDTSAAPYASFLIEDGDLRLQATRRA